MSAPFRQACQVREVITSGNARRSAIRSVLRAVPGGPVHSSRLAGNCGLFGHDKHQPAAGRLGIQACGSRAGDGRKSPERKITSRATRGTRAFRRMRAVPTCAVIGHPELRPLKPSEEHLPMEVQDGAQSAAIGETLYLIPRHVCPTVSLFDDALIVRNNCVVRVERVTARGHTSPVPGEAAVPA